MRRLWFAILAALTASTVTELSADNWPGWRGPHGNGVVTGTGFPSEWDSSRNVAWKVELPGSGSSTPAVWGQKIFVTSGEGKNFVTCYTRGGKELWRQTVGEEKPGKHKKATGANSSPTTDGDHVYVYFKSGDLACLDLDGKLVWQKNLQSLYGEDTLWWDLGTSPVLTKRFVVVACMQTGPSYLVAFDKQTGREAWKHDRNLDAPIEAAQSYSTPIVLEQEGRETIVVLGADHVTTHDARDGGELWRVGGLNPTGHKFFRSIASPVVSDGLVIAPYARGGSLTAIRLGGGGDVTSSHIAWSIEKDASADVPTPAAFEGRVYICRDRGEVVCRDVKSGDEIWTFSLPRFRQAFSSSPILADGKLYLTREDGTTFVIKADKPQLLATNSLEEMTVATPVFVDGQIIIRTLHHLYCLGEPK